MPLFVMKMSAQNAAYILPCRERTQTAKIIVLYLIMNQTILQKMVNCIVKAHFP